MATMTNDGVEDGSGRSNDAQPRRHNNVAKGKTRKLHGGGGGGGAPFPPRPRAIATFLSSRDFLPGCQTLLYSLKAHLAPTPKDEYPPEIVVLLSSKVATNDAARMTNFLCSTFCHRVIPVEHIPIVEESNNHRSIGDGGEEEEEEEGGNKKPRSHSSSSHVKTWDENCGWTKLRLFQLEGGYDTVLYIDADCLVVRDVGHLLHIDDDDDGAPTTTTTEGNDKAPTAPRRSKRTGLLAAAPDIFPPDKFNAGVMVIRPSESVFREMMSRLPTKSSNSAPEEDGSSRSRRCTSYDGGDTGFLNSFYPGWYNGGNNNGDDDDDDDIDITMPPISRLPFGYNAQRFMHHCTHDKRPEYWDVAVGDDLKIIHYSSSPKPWDAERDIDDDVITGGGDKTEEERKRAYLDGREAHGMRTAKRGELENMWHAAYKRSQEYFLTNRLGHGDDDKKRKSSLSSSKSSSSERKAAADVHPSYMPPASSSMKFPPKRLSTDQLVRLRYKEFRRAGMDTKKAMKTARMAYGLDKADERMDPSRAVGQMFGL